MRLVLGMLIAAAAGGCVDRSNGVLQGYAEGEYLRVASPIAGQLARLNVARGDSVKAGDPLFSLESENEAAARRQAEEQLRQADAQYRNLLTGKRPEEMEAIRAQLAQAEASLSLSESNLARQEELVRARFVSKEAADTARTARDRDRGRVNELKAQLSAARLAARPDEIRAAKAATAAAREALAQAEWRLEQKSLRAPRDARVTDTLYLQGEWVQAGSPVISLLPPANIKVRFFVPEGTLASVRIGQTAKVRCDGCGESVSAVIGYISSQAEYTPPVIYSRENRSKLVFLVEARPEPSEATRLHPGQPVEVTLR
ncbi:MAG: HlyD family efflux transporter periplasmic adaptor subunit [Burkholderiales bacterium]